MKRIHFQGIGGVGMAGVAFLLKRRGHDVTGCDKYASPRTRWLEANGIPVALGHSPAHLAGIDELVVTPAVPQSDPELSAAKGLSPQPPKGLSPHIRIRYRGEVLAELVNASDGIAVCGTHGKTTTATFTARLLHALGTDPSWCIGGETGDMPVACEGTGPIVVEADESDGTLALYRAHTLVITSIDFDHPEHFKSVEDYHACYDTAAAAATDVIRVWELDPSDWPELEHLVVGRHNVMNARAAIEVALRRGHSREAISAALPSALSELPDRRFERIWPLKSSSTIPHSPFPDLTAKALAAAVPHSPFPVPHSPITVYTDYAHHPAELKCAVGMAAELKPTRLRVLFQPHRYSRTKALLNEFPPAFAEADEVVLIPVYPAFEEPIPGGDIADLYAAFRESHSKLPEPPIREGRNLLRPQREGRAPARPIILARSAEEAWKHVLLSAAPGDLILLAGAGDIINLVPRIQHDLSSDPSSSILNPQSSILNPQSSILNLQSLSFFRTGGATVGGGKRTIVGMGSNTWFSDCVTDIEIVRAPAAELNHPHSKGIPAGVPGASLLADHPELAFMAGIPGTVGGWTKMNAGAFGDSFGNYVDHVVADGKIIPHDACGFGYRTSAIDGLITEVVLRGDDRDHRDHRDSRDHQEIDTPTAKDYLARRKTFPPRTCGSVFKNPSPDMPAGRLLDEAGAKSMRVGGAYVWSEHANVIVAGEGCTSSDILALARLMARAVFFRSGIRLEPEIRGLEV